MSDIPSPAAGEAGPSSAQTTSMTVPASRWGVCLLVAAAAAWVMLNYTPVQFDTPEELLSVDIYSPPELQTAAAEKSVELYWKNSLTKLGLRRPLPRRGGPPGRGERRSAKTMGPGRAGIGIWRRLRSSDCCAGHLSTALLRQRCSPADGRRKYPAARHRYGRLHVDQRDVGAADQPGRAGLGRETAWPEGRFHPPGRCRNRFRGSRDGVRRFAHSPNERLSTHGLGSHDHLAGGPCRCWSSRSRP